jgi:hypothetical protein
MYLGLLVLLAISNSTALAQVGCVTNPYISGPKWTDYFYGTYYYDSSINSNYYSGFNSGMTTWNQAPYASPYFSQVSSAPANGLIRFVSLSACGNPNAVGCADVNTAGGSWRIDYRSDVCWTSVTGVPGCYYMGHLSNHEYGHVMTLDHNYHYTGGVADSIVGDVRDSTDPIGGLRSRGCGDNNALSNRY